MSIQVANAHHFKDDSWKRDPNCVYIGRGSKWGNPYVMRPCPAKLNPELPPKIARKLLAKVQELWAKEERMIVINAYAAYLKYNEELQASLYQLEGKTLICFCAPLHCHGHVLAKAVENRSRATVARDIELLLAG